MPFHSFASCAELGPAGPPAHAPFKISSSAAAALTGKQGGCGLAAAHLVTALGCPESHRPPHRRTPRPPRLHAASRHSVSMQQTIRNIDILARRCWTSLSSISPSISSTYSTSSSVTYSSSSVYSSSSSVTTMPCSLTEGMAPLMGSGLCSKCEIAVQMLPQGKSFATC